MLPPPAGFRPRGPGAPTAGAGSGVAAPDPRILAAGEAAAPTEAEAYLREHSIALEGGSAQCRPVRRFAGETV